MMYRYLCPACEAGQFSLWCLQLTYKSMQRDYDKYRGVEHKPDAGGGRKGDEVPELDALLEENYLRRQAGYRGGMTEEVLDATR